MGVRLQDFRSFKKANVGGLFVLSVSSSFYDNLFWENSMSMVSNWADYMLFGNKFE